MRADFMKATDLDQRNMSFQHVCRDFVTYTTVHNEGIYILASIWLLNVATDGLEIPENLS